MKIIVKKNDNDYSLKIESGHFSGTLEQIPTDIIKELKDNLSVLLTEGETGHTKTLIWNPRSQRHEMVNK